MNRENTLIDTNAEILELDNDYSLRPKNLLEYIGQDSLKTKLKVFIEAAQKRHEALDHMLFYGPPGLGKTSLANIIAKEMGSQFKSTSGPVIERPGDLAAILTNLEENDVLFIDEIHRLSHVVEEILYPAMEDYQLDIVIGQGPAAKSIKLDLPKFTLVGATTRAGLLTSPLRERFGFAARLEFYSSTELAQIVSRSSRILKIPMDTEGALEIASRSRGTPRIANRLLRRVRDFAQVKGDGTIDKKIADYALKILEVDPMGLDQMDRRLLQLMAERFSGGPVGLDSLASALGEESGTIEDVYEPFLIQSGYIQRTARGRVLCNLAYEHLGLPKPELF